VETVQISRLKKKIYEERKEKLIPIMTNASTLAGSMWKRRDRNTIKHELASLQLKTENSN